MSLALRETDWVANIDTENTKRNSVKCGIIYFDVRVLFTLSSKYDLPKILMNADDLCINTKDKNSFVKFLADRR